MGDNLTIIIIFSVIASLILLIVILFSASVVRRALNNAKYRKLDMLRQEYRRRVRHVLGGEGVVRDVEPIRVVPGSLTWRAVEDVLFDLSRDDQFGDQVKELFQRLGYVTHYEQVLRSRNVLIKASAIDKLGRMGFEPSTTKLLPLLDDRLPEIRSVTVRALSRIGSLEGLVAITDRLPVLLGRGYITRKAMETSLLNFGEHAITFLAEYHAHDTDPWNMSCVLETLSHLPPDARSTSMAVEHLDSVNPEVRSKALKVLGRADQDGGERLLEQILPLLDDPVWFVRLQAVKSAKSFANEVAAKAIGRRLFDENWNVRDEAAVALTRYNAWAVDVFHDALTAEDGYAKESVCEEIEKSRFVDWLIDHVNSGDEMIRTKSRQILGNMHALGFSTPLVEYLETSADERTKQEVRKLLAAGAG